MRFHDVLHVWTAVEIGSFAYHVGLDEVYCLSCGPMSFDVEI